MITIKCQTQGSAICQSVLENNVCPEQLFPVYLLSADVWRSLEDSYRLVKQWEFFSPHRYYWYGGTYSPTGCQIWDHEGIFPTETLKNSVLQLTQKLFYSLKGVHRLQPATLALCSHKTGSNLGLTCTKESRLRPWNYKSVMIYYSIFSRITNQLCSRQHPH